MQGQVKPPQAAAAAAAGSSKQQAPPVRSSLTCDMPCQKQVLRHGQDKCMLLLQAASLLYSRFQILLPPLPWPMSRVRNLCCCCCCSNVNCCCCCCQHSPTALQSVHISQMARTPAWWTGWGAQCDPRRQQSRDPLWTGTAIAWHLCVNGTQGGGHWR
jgi:hypothetical protein